MKKLSILLTFLSAVLLTACNGHNEDDSQSDTDDTQNTITDETVRLGYFDDSNSFVEGKIKLSLADNTVSAGGTIGLSVTLVDSSNAIVTTPVTVTFSSSCATNGNATLDESVITSNGSASSTFADISCAGTSGNEDVVSASISVNELTISASETITITGERLGSIEFISAEPSNIVLKGSGGVNQQESSTITFLVKSALGNALAQQEVEFTLDSVAGGVSLSKTSGVTNNDGFISTQVASGTVPTTVRVTATASLTVDGETTSIQSQSDLLSINTGLPHQASMSIAADNFNLEAGDYNGETAAITVQLADNFNNPVADGTTVNFTTEGGSIEPSCTTVAGACSVTWTSGDPKPVDHRVTILATAIGHESFVDTNGNNVFDNADGSAIADVAFVSSGFGTIADASSGFNDMSEAWRDDNANGSYEVGEVFIDINGNETFDDANGLFNGPQCQGDLCAAADSRSINIRRAIELVMSGSEAVFSLTNGDGSIVFQSAFESSDVADITELASQAFLLHFTDSAGQKLPAGTTVEVSFSAGTVSGVTNYTVSNTNSSEVDTIAFSLTNGLDDEAELVELNITFTTPKGDVTSLTPINIQLL
ncbi:Ig-like protein, group 1 [Thalassotalea sp. PLHSN55]|uniref:Ig-like protein, group 1 n=1 Tax=Thalassotalea sp. PLHSN55 TaxID=3435888 RepID=UPI003F87981E